MAKKNVWHKINIPTFDIEEIVNILILKIEDYNRPPQDYNNFKNNFDHFYIFIIGNYSEYVNLGNPYSGIGSFFIKIINRYPKIGINLLIKTIRDLNRNTLSAALRTLNNNEWINIEKEKEERMLSEFFDAIENERSINKDRELNMIKMHSHQVAFVLWLAFMNYEKILNDFEIYQWPKLDSIIQGDKLLRIIKQEKEDILSNFQRLNSKIEQLNKLENIEVNSFHSTNFSNDDDFNSSLLDLNNNEVSTQSHSNSVLTPSIEQLNFRTEYFNNNFIPLDIQFEQHMQNMNYNYSLQIIPVNFQYLI